MLPSVPTVFEAGHPRSNTRGSLANLGGAIDLRAALQIRRRFRFLSAPMLSELAVLKAEQVKCDATAATKFLNLMNNSS